MGGRYRMRLAALRMEPSGHSAHRAVTDLPDVGRLALMENLLLRAMTNSCEKRGGSVVMSQYAVGSIPARNIAHVGEGSFAIDGLSGARRAAVENRSCEPARDQRHHGSAG